MEMTKININLIFRTSNEEILSRIFKRTVLKCEERNNIRFMLIQLMEKKKHQTSYAIDSVNGMFGVCGSLTSESNHASVKIFVIAITEGIH